MPVERGIEVCEGGVNEGGREVSVKNQSGAKSLQRHKGPKGIIIFVIISTNYFTR